MYRNKNLFFTVEKRWRPDTRHAFSNFHIRQYILCKSMNQRNTWNIGPFHQIHLSPMRNRDYWAEKIRKQTKLRKLLKKKIQRTDSINDIWPSREVWEWKDLKHWGNILKQARKVSSSRLEQRMQGIWSSRAICCRLYTCVLCRKGSLCTSVKCFSSEEITVGLEMMARDTKLTLIILKY